MPRKDLNQLAATIVAQATDEDEIPSQQPGLGSSAAAIARMGGRKGGPARAAKLTPEQRQAIAKKAAAARWKKTA